MPVCKIVLTALLLLLVKAALLDFIILIIHALHVQLDNIMINNNKLALHVQHNAQPVKAQIIVQFVLADIICPINLVLLAWHIVLAVMGLKNVLTVQQDIILPIIHVLQFAQQDNSMILVH